jgi:hypothetical protein
MSDAPHAWIDLLLALLIPWGGLLTGLALLALLTAFRVRSYWVAELWTYAAALGALGLLILGWQDDLQPIDLALWSLCVAAGLALMGLWYRDGVRWFDTLKTRLTGPAADPRDSRSDIRAMASLLPAARGNYDPRVFYRPDHYLMGLGTNGNPLYWTGRLPHIAVVGSSGAGKGRKLQDLAAQAVQHGEALIYLDPKDDEWGPHALYAACQEARVPYRYLHLHPDAPPQFNLLAGATATEIADLLQSALDLGDKGQSADYYMAKNRAAAHYAAELAAAGRLTLADVHARLADDPHWQDEAPGFLDRLGELASLPAINGHPEHHPAPAWSLETLVRDGGGLYVVGSMTASAILRAQRMLFVRAQQLASRRDRILGPLRTVCVIADETKYHISRTILQGLGASRDKGMRVVLAFQSFGDLNDGPQDMDPEAIVGAIVGNTPAKFIYRIEDPDTALWIARRTGSIRIAETAQTVERNLALAETRTGERTLRDGERHLFDTNVLQSLNEGWGILIGQGLAKLCFASPYPTQKCRAAITPHAVPSEPHPDHERQERIDTSDSAAVLPRQPARKTPRHDGFFALEGS